MRRSRSVDLSCISRERYSSRWSRENTPMDGVDRYAQSVRRSFTPIRDMAGYEALYNDSRSRSVDCYRSPLGIVSKPLHVNVNYYTENQPVRKYDVFQARTWSYPIYKYLYGRDQHYSRPYSYTRQYGLKTLYTPSLMTPEVSSMTDRRSYSGYNYVAGEHSFNLSAKPWSISNYRFLRVSHIASMPWYWHGRSNLRHYNSYRPPPYTSRLSTYWKSYF